MTAHDTSAVPAVPVVVTSTASDSHTWNLVYLQLLLEERGCAVRNLGACVPDELMVAECVLERPRLVVISSVNGHGFNDGLRVVPKLRARPELAGASIVIGGKLGITGECGDDWRARLLDAGADRVFGDGDIDEFRGYLDRVAERIAA